MERRRHDPSLARRDLVPDRSIVLCATGLHYTTLHHYSTPHSLPFPPLPARTSIPPLDLPLDLDLDLDLPLDLDSTSPSLLVARRPAARPRAHRLTAAPNALLALPISQRTPAHPSASPPVHQHAFRPLPRPLPVARAALAVAAAAQPGCPSSIHVDQQQQQR